MSLFTDFQIGNAYLGSRSPEIQECFLYCWKLEVIKVRRLFQSHHIDLTRLQTVSITDIQLDCLKCLLIV